MSYLNISNILSLCRAPLAFLFLPKIRILRMMVVILAGVSDYLDGFLARRLKKTSPLGAVLDPVMDKVFMLMAIGTLLWEGALGPWGAIAMVSRDLCLVGFLTFVTVTRTWRGLQACSIWWGKVTTVAQYLFVLMLIGSVSLPGWVFGIFPLLAALYVGELLLYYRTAH